jgi:hypothetical protein
MFLPAPGLEVLAHALPRVLAGQVDFVGFSIKATVPTPLPSLMAALPSILEKRQVVVTGLLIATAVGAMGCTASQVCLTH